MGFFHRASPQKGKKLKIKGAPVRGFGADLPSDPWLCGGYIRCLYNTWILSVTCLHIPVRVYVYCTETVNDFQLRAIGWSTDQGFRRSKPTVGLLKVLAQVGH